MKIKKTCQMTEWSCWKPLWRSHVICKGFFSMTTLWFDKIFNFSVRMHRIFNFKKGDSSLMYYSKLMDLLLENGFLGWGQFLQSFFRSHHEKLHLYLMYRSHWKKLYENKVFQLGLTWKGLVKIPCFYKVKIVQTNGL